MSPEQYRQHACGRKVPFTSRSEARVTARLTEDRSGGGRMKPYACKFEDHWHIGHDLSKKARRAARGR